MTTKPKIIIILLLALSTVVSAKNYKEIPWLKTAIDRSQEQLLAASEKYKAGKLNPRSFENGKVCFANFKDWTCGFFPGSLWYMYELTNNEQFKKGAEFYTEILDQDQCCRRRHKGDLVDLIAFEELVADLDDAFHSHFLALKVGPDEQLVVVFGQVEYPQYLVHTVSGDMIDNRAVFNGRYL